MLFHSLPPLVSASTDAFIQIGATRDGPFAMQFLSLSLSRSLQVLCTQVSELEIEIPSALHGAFKL